MAPPGRTRGLPGILCLALGLLLVAYRWNDTSIPSTPTPFSLAELVPRTGWQHARLTNGQIDWGKRLYRAWTADGPALCTNDPRTPVEVASPDELFARRVELLGALVTVHQAPAPHPLFFHSGGASVVGVRGPAPATKSTKLLSRLDEAGRVWAFSTRFDSADSEEARAFLGSGSITGYVTPGAGQWAGFAQAYGTIGGKLPEESVTVQVLPDLDVSDLELWAPLAGGTGTWVAVRGVAAPSAGATIQGVYRRIWGTWDDPAFYRSEAPGDRPTGVLVLGDTGTFLDHLGASRWQPFGLALLAAGLLIGAGVATLSREAVEAKHNPRQWGWVMDLHVALGIATLATAWQMHEFQGSFWVIVVGAGAFALALADALVFAAYKNPIALACRHSPVLRALMGGLTVLVGLTTLALTIVPLVMRGRGLGRLMRSLYVTAFLVAYGAAAVWYGAWILIDPEAAVD